MFTVPHRTAFSHRHSIIPSVALALVLANLNPGFAASDDQVIASDPPFKLRASVVDLGLEPAISGENGAEDGGLYGALSPEGTGAGMGMPSTEPGQGTARVVANDGSEPLAVAAKSASDKTDKKVQKAGAEAAESQAEAGVDWSGWASALADRWFWNLKNLEYTSKKQFSTKRPALIRFTCYRDGTIGSIALQQSCGLPAYDQMEIEALKRCVPLPPFPAGSRRTRYTLLQGWDAHPRQPGQGDFKPGSYGKNFPVEKIPQRTRIR